MQPINKDGYVGQPANEKALGSVIAKSNNAKRRVVKSLLGYIGIFVGFFIVFIVIIVFTTEINLASFEMWTQLGLMIFVLLFCSYSMFINGSDSGIKAGRESQIYLSTKAEYDSLKKEIIEHKYQARACEFCRNYIDNELRETRTNILAGDGIDYDVYIAEYIGKDRKSLLADNKLSKSQVTAIIRANKTRPVTLTPEMIFKKGRGISRRHPLGIRPETKRSVGYVLKFMSTAITSIFTGVIVLDVIVAPTWITISQCCLKLLPIILNGFFGYKIGYENITVDTVNYTQDQIDLMTQFVQYVTSTPAPKKHE